MQLRFRDKHKAIPIEVRANDAFAVKVVAVAGYAQDWVAYCGPSDWPDALVAEQGTKLTKEQAGELFHCMCTRVYRG